MAIPKIVTPTYECELPSTKQKIKFRPFLVKEEKVMLVALEADNDDSIREALVKIVSNCIDGELDVEKLPIFDFEYLFLKIRSKSVGEVVKLKLKCPDDEKVTVDYELNLDEIKVEIDPKSKLEVPFTESYGVVLRYPTIREVMKDDETSLLSLSLIKDCLKMIYNGDDTYYRKDITDEEFDEWIDTLTKDQFDLLVKWFKSVPKIEHVIKYSNPKSGKEFSLKLSGTKDFF